jgi:hypothetical protein
VDRRRLGAIAGIIAPVLFVTVFTLEGWLRPGYDWRSMYVSELALGWRGTIQIGDFLIFGVLQLLFARGMAVEFPSGKASGPIALRLIGVGMIGAGLFVMDPLPTPIASLSWHGWLHSLSGQLIFYGWPASCFIFLRRFREEPAWRSLAPWTFTAGVVTAVLPVILLVVLLVVRLDPGNWVGAWGASSSGRIRSPHWGGSLRSQSGYWLGEMGGIVTQRPATDDGADAFSTN